MLSFQYNDGGRAAAGYKGYTGDCATRAIAIATEQPYQDVYEAISLLGSKERKTKGRKRKSHARTGVYGPTLKKYMNTLPNWRWVPCMTIGSGCSVHLKADELPSGRLIVRVSRHVVAVIDGVIHDTHNCSRDGTRCVYGYWIKDSAD